MSIESNLERLSNINGVTGREEAARELMIKLIKPYVDETCEDNLGNVISIKKGKEHGYDLRVYRCPDCRLYHLTSLKTSY